MPGIRSRILSMVLCFPNMSFSLNAIKIAVNGTIRLRQFLCKKETEPLGLRFLNIKDLQDPSDCR